MRTVLYFCAALIAMLVNMASRFVFSKWLPFGLSVFLAYWVGHIVNFILSNTLVFKGKDERNTTTTFLKFTLVACVGLAVTFVMSLLARLLMEKLFPLWNKEARDAVAHFIGIGFSFVFNYAGHVLFSFKNFHKSNGFNEEVKI